MNILRENKDITLEDMLNSYIHYRNCGKSKLVNALIIAQLEKLSRRNIMKMITEVDEDLKVYEVETLADSIYVVGNTFPEKLGRRTYKIENSIFVCSSNIIDIKEVCTVNEFNYISTHYSTACILPEGLKKYIEEIVLDEYKQEDIKHISF